jgi:hypothetical protein
LIVAIDGDGRRIRPRIEVVKAAPRFSEAVGPGVGL